MVIRIYFEVNDYENIKYEDLWEAGEFISLNIYICKEERLKTNE
jgi:hypothetical protein